jgi:hypothetical protein
VPATPHGQEVPTALDSQFYSTGNSGCLPNLLTFADTKVQAPWLEQLRRSCGTAHVVRGTGFTA